MINFTKMGEMDSPLLNKSVMRNSFNIIDEYEEMNMPYTLGNCVTFKYLPQLNQFNFSEHYQSTCAIVHGKISETELNQDLQRLNSKSSLNPPSFWLKFAVTLIFMILVLLVCVLLLVIWAILILDLVFLAFSLYLIRKVVIIAWVLRTQFIEKSYFSGLKKVVKDLNKKYHKVGLNWKLGSYRKWLQLGEKSTQHNVLGN